MNRMRKVLIADDEVKVGQLVKRLIQWDRLGLTCIGLVTDGQTAYEKILSESPDIVITDIRMPGVDRTGNDPEGIRAGREMPFYSCQWI